jgi:hypothetical protein
MAVVNVGTAITKALTKLEGGLSRANFVVWFNEIVRDILNVPRVWQFLTTPLSIAIVDSQITIPAGFSEVVSIQVGDVFLTTADQQTDEEAAIIDAAGEGVQGYSLSAAGVITFHPALTGTALVTGETDITSDYADNAATIFPLAFQNLFVTGLRMHHYDLQKDGRYGKENTLYQLEMGKMRAWDNRLKPLPRYDRHGYVRGGA